MNYTIEFKRICVKKLLLSKDKNAYQLAEELGISKSSLYKWKSEFSVEKENDEHLAKNWSREEKVNALLHANKLSEPDFGRWLREQGLRSEHLKLWENEVKQMPSSKDKQELKAAKKRIKELERDLNKKDKALAEVSALLILKKKAQELWGDEEK